METENIFIRATERWLKEFVIGQNLCPFANKEVSSNSVRIIESDAQNQEELLAALYTEIQYLREQTEISTTLIVHPNVLNDFADYNQFLDLADGLLEQQGWLGVFQVASFHPDYQFADTEIDNAENFTNRSPYPMLHILREEQVEQAIESFADIEQVPTNNIRLMNEIGVTQLQTQLSEYLK
ncbi:MAG: DUF1415 domain-containing protein [Acidiferrobacterales bacterium]|nr:DUF1415 domain-containing protein [Acidiferrobacterales bacterium]